jgi:hypothetical protein
MSTMESIPPEARASVEANALFDAVRRGDYAAAAKAQERLRELGWIIAREGRHQKIKRGAPSCQKPPA